MRKIIIEAVSVSLALVAVAPINLGIADFDAGGDGDFGQVLSLKGGYIAFVGDEHLADAWYEQGVGTTAASGTDWRIWPTPSSEWVEIDDESDYAAAVALTQVRD